jgi:hypothetical protein
MQFCSASGLQGFSNISCPIDCVTRNSPFWNAASIDFARKASGVATVILNGTRPSGAISKTSTFLNYELPQLSSENVTKLVVFLLHNPGFPKYETCKNISTLNLVIEVLNKNNITYECDDNPEDILYFMCFQNPQSGECQAIRNILNKFPVLVPNSLLLTLALFLNFHFSKAFFFLYS